jgi:Activator of Hsp90 ATPase homolog 1-like protein
MKQAKDFTCTITVDQSPAEVFNAVNNVRGWWQGIIQGNTDRLNEAFTYQMGDLHFTRQKIVEMVPGKKIVWLVTESRINFVADKNEWLHTTIIFDIAAMKNKTKLSFTHRGLVPAIECYNGCSGAWGLLIDKSLYSLITTGKGVEVF